MEIVDYAPRTARTNKLPWKPIKLMPLGDIQAGTASCSLDLLERNVARGLREDCLFIGMGDYLDVASPSNRAKLKSAGFYDSVRDMMDEAMHREEELLMKILEPTAGRWLGMLEGHHTWEYQDGTTTDINLCRRLNTRFLGHCTMVRLHFAAGPHVVDCVVYAHHGVGSGTTIAAPLTKLERVLEWAEADLYLMGHQHKRVAALTPRFYMVGKKEPTILTRERLLVGTGSYLKGYMRGSTANGRTGGTYVEQAMMRPVSLGSPIITVTPVRKTLDGHDVTLVEFETIT